MSCRVRGSVWVAGLAVCLAGCQASIPLGGIAPGRGHPIGRGAAAHLGIGKNVELVGTLPEVYEENGTELLNPIPNPDSLTTPAGSLDAGLTVAFVDWFDVGISRSRGLHAMVRLLGGDHWAWSASPALYWYRADANGGLFGSQFTARASNRNITSLVSVSTAVQEELIVDAWAGGGYSSFRSRLGRDDWARSSSGTARSVMFGVRAAGRRERYGRREPTVTELGLTMEVTATWLRQRNGRSDVVPILRVFFTLGSRSGREASDEGP